MTLVPKGGGIFGTDRICLIWFTLNVRASKFDVNDVQLMTVFEPEIKMAAINRKKVRAITFKNTIPFYWKPTTTRISFHSTFKHVEVYDD